MYEFKLPDLGEGIHEGEILKWHVRPGETVAEDAPLVDVETDKAAVTIPSPRAGKVVRVAGEVGDIVETGQVVAVIDDGSGGAVGEAAGAGEAVAAAPAAESPAPTGRAAEEMPAGLPEAEEEESTAPAAARTAPGSPVVPGRPVPAAPAVRRLARELGVDLAAVAGSGPGGRVLAEDVRAAAAGGVPAGPAAAASGAAAGTGPVPAGGAGGIPFLEIEPLPDFARWGPVETEPLRSIRRRVAQKMTTSMILVPHVAHMDEADVTELEDFRTRVRDEHVERGGGKLTLLSFVIRAVTAGLKAAPAFNASLDPFAGRIVYKKYYHIGFAADTGRGLVVPVIKDADRKSVNEISRELAEKAALAREGKLPLTDMQGGTFTITNVGPLGGTALIPTINYPEVAILGMGRVQEKPVVRDGQIVIRKMLPLTLAFDHRVADGADAARFVGELVRWLSDPKQLLIDL